MIWGHCHRLYKQRLKFNVSIYQSAYDAVSGLPLSRNVPISEQQGATLNVPEKKSEHRNIGPCNGSHVGIYLHGIIVRC